MRRLTVPTALRRATRLVPASVALASALLFLSSLLWAVQTPVFQAPDELTHISSVLRVAEGGGWPRPGDARVEDEVMRARGMAGAATPEGNTVFPGDHRAAPGAPLFADVQPPAPDVRASFDSMDGGEVIANARDQMSQHPPGYYAAAALVYNLADAGHWRFDRAVFLLRMLTALTIALTVPVCCYVAARQLSGRESVGKVAAFVPLLIPQLEYIGGAVTNDGVTIALTSVVWAVLLTITCSGPTGRRLVLLTLALGAACWTKGTALSVLPLVPVAIAIGYRRARGGSLRDWGVPALVAVAGSLGGAFVLGGWWWALNLLRYGTLQPDGLTSHPRDGDVLSPFGFLQVFLPRIRWTFFGEVGVRQPQGFAALTIALAVLFVVVCAAGLISRHRVADRLLILAGLGLTGGMLFATTYAGHLTVKGFPGIQGRYLFVLVVPIAVLFATGLVGLARLVRLREEHALAGIALAGLAVSLLGVGLGFRVFYTVGDSWGNAIDRLLGWAAWSPPVLVVLVAAFALCALALAWTLGRESAATITATGLPATEHRLRSTNGIGVAEASTRAATGVPAVAASVHGSVRVRPDNDPPEFGRRAPVATGGSGISTAI